MSPKSSMGPRDVTAESTPNANRRRRSDDTELQLLRNATWLFSERGFDGTSIRDIGGASNVAVSAMYYYARSKEDVLIAVMQRGLDRLAGGGAEALEDIEGAESRLATLITFHIAFHARNPRTARVVDQEFRALSGKSRKVVLALRDAYEALWTGVLQQGVEEGKFVDYGKLSSFALLEMCTGIAHWYKPRGKLSVPELCRYFVEMGLALVSVRQGGCCIDALQIPSPDEITSLVSMEIEPRKRPVGLSG